MSLDLSSLQKAVMSIIEQKYEVIQKPASAKPQSTKNGVFGHG